MLELLVPVLSVHRDPDFYRIPGFPVLFPHLLRRCDPRLVVVQQQSDFLQMGILLEVSVQRPAVQPAKSYSVGGYLPAEGAEAHEVDGGLEDGYFLDIRVTGQTKADLFVTAGDIAFEAGAVQVTGAAFVGEFGLTIAIPANENAVVILLVLVEQSASMKAPIT